MTTKALNVDYILATSVNNSPISGVSGAATAQINAIGQNVTKWDVDALILYKTENTINYREGGGTFILIPQDQILFAYTSEAES